MFWTNCLFFRQIAVVLFNQKLLDDCMAKIGRFVSQFGLLGEVGTHLSKLTKTAPKQNIIDQTCPKPDQGGFWPHGWVIGDQ